MAETKSSEPGAHEDTASDSHKRQALRLCKPISQRAIGSDMKRMVLFRMDQSKQIRRLGAGPPNSKFSSVLLRLDR